MAAVDNVASLFLEKIDENGTVSLSSSKIQVNVQKLKANATGMQLYVLMTLTKNTSGLKTMKVFNEPTIMMVITQ